MLNIKPFRQKVGSCGPASLKMVLSYFGVTKTEKDLAKLTRCTPKQGIPAKNIVEAAHALGFSAFTKDNSSFKEIRFYVIKDKIPVIVDWFYHDDGHYSVVADIDKENIYLLDPSLGHVRAMRLPDFYRVWFDFNGDFIATKNDLILRRIIVIHPKKTR